MTTKIVRVISWCGFVWEDGGLDHGCGQHGEHTMHLCDEDGCAAHVPVGVAGGRKYSKKTGRPPRVTAPL